MRIDAAQAAAQPQLSNLLDFRLQRLDRCAAVAAATATAAAFEAATEAEARWMDGKRSGVTDCGLMSSHHHFWFWGLFPSKGKMEMDNDGGGGGASHSKSLILSAAAAHAK